MTERKFAFIMVSSSYWISFFIIGCLDGSMRKHCEYDSIAGRFNPALRIGCEYAKPRWKKK